MREIKFRGKSRLGLKPWITGFFMEDESEQRFLSWKPDGDNFQLTPVYYESVGQFTGLKDKKGKEIYEGDIIKYDLAEGLGEPYRDDLNPEEVKWIGLGFSIGHFHTNIQVIGNVYENPELLK